MKLISFISKCGKAVFINMDKVNSIQIYYLKEDIKEIKIFFENEDSDTFELSIAQSESVLKQLNKIEKGV